MTSYVISYMIWYHRYDIIELWYHDLWYHRKNYDIIVQTMISGVPRFQMDLHQLSSVPDLERSQKTSAAEHSTECPLVTAGPGARPGRDANCYRRPTGQSKSCKNVASGDRAIQNDESPCSSRCSGCSARAAIRHAGGLGRLSARAPGPGRLKAENLLHLDCCQVR